MRNPLVILLILLWLLLGFFYYTSSNECCNEPGVSEAAVPVVKEQVLTGPLLFESNKEGAITGDGWEAMRNRILASTGSEKVLEIVGKYRSSEVNKTEFDNLGLARARDVRKLFPELPDERVRELAKLLDDNGTNSPFEAADFAYRVNNSSIKEVDDKTRIYFPFSSTDKLNDTKVESYLDDVAERVIKSGEKVKLVGHTDSVSSPDFNKRLGQKRANVVASYLKSKGVPANQILASSLGETSPIAGNDTEAGRAENRRTELQIIK